MKICESKVFNMSFDYETKIDEER